MKKRIASALVFLVTKTSKNIQSMYQKGCCEEKHVASGISNHVHIHLWFKKELNASTYPIYLFLFQRFKCTTLVIKELLLNLLHFIFNNIAVFIKP